MIGGNGQQNGKGTGRADLGRELATRSSDSVCLIVVREGAASGKLTERSGLGKRILKRKQSCLGNEEERGCSLGRRQRKRKAQGCKTGKEIKGMLRSEERSMCVHTFAKEKMVCTCVQRITGKQAET